MNPNPKWEGEIPTALKEGAENVQKAMEASGGHLAVAMATLKDGRHVAALHAVTDEDDEKRTMVPFAILTDPKEFMVGTDNPNNGKPAPTMDVHLRAMDPHALVALLATLAGRGASKKGDPFGLPSLPHLDPHTKPN